MGVGGGWVIWWGGLESVTFYTMNPNLNKKMRGEAEGWRGGGG